MPDTDKDQSDMPRVQEEHTNDGWVKVGRGKGKKPTYLQGLDRPSRDITIEQITRDFDTKLKNWRASTCRRETLQILRRVRPDDGWHFENAVCLATGSFSRDNLENRKRSMWQLAMFYDLVQFLQRDQDGSISMIAQEPEYTPLDETFLRSLDIQVLDCKMGDFNDQDVGIGPAVEFMTSNCLLFEPFMNIGSAAMRDLLGSDPMLYMGSSFARRNATKGKTDAQIKADIKADITEDGDDDIAVTDTTIQEEKETCELERKFANSRRHYKLPRFEEDPNVLEGMCIYWKEPHDEDEG